MNNNNLYGLKCYVAPPAMAEDYFYSGNPSGWREDDKGDMYYRSEFYTYAFYIGYVNSCGKYLESTVFDAKGFKQDNIADALTAYTTYQDKFFAYLAKQQGYTEHKAFVCEKSSNLKLFCVPDKGYLVNAATQDIQNVINQDTLPINEYGEPLFSNVYYDDGFDNHLDGYALVLALKDKSVSPALQYFDFRNEHSDAANLIYYGYKNSPDDDTSVSWDLYEQMNSSGIGLSDFIGLFRGTLDGHDYIKYDENTCTTIDDNLNSIGLPLINGLQRCELPLALNIEPYVLTNLSDSSSGKFPDKPQGRDYSTIVYDITPTCIGDNTCDSGSGDIGGGGCSCPTCTGHSHCSACSCVCDTGYTGANCDPIQTTITLDNANATTNGTGAIYTTYNTGVYLNSGRTQSMTTSANAITIPQRTGYTFNGYYSTASGSGTQYIDADGKITSGGLSQGKEYTSTITWHARWTENVVSGAITLDSKIYISASDQDGYAANTSASPATIYTKYNTGVYTSVADANAGTNTITHLTTIPVITSGSPSVFNGFYTGKAGTGIQIVDQNGDFLPAAITQVTTAGDTPTWYAKYTTCVCTDGANVLSCAPTGRIVSNSCEFNVDCEGGYVHVGQYSFTFTADAGVGASVTPGCEDRNETEISFDSNLYASNTATTGTSPTTDPNAYVEVNIIYGIGLEDSNNEPVGIPTLTGYQFNGYWTTKESGGIQIVDANGYFTAGAATGFPTKSIATVYAHWIRTSCPSSQMFYNDSCIDAAFTLTTTATNTFSFNLSAAGIFYVDWGDGTIEQINRTNNTTNQTYSHNYANTATRTIRLGSPARATAYTSTPATAAISFDTDNNGTNAAKITSVSGSLGAIFPGASKFCETFKNTTSLTSVPNTLFSGSNVSAEDKFYATFSNSGITSVPVGLFPTMSDGCDDYMYQSTFSGSSLATIPNGFTFGLSGCNGAEYMFDNTFYGTPLTSVPSSLFSGITGVSVGMFTETFRDSDLSSIPNGLFPIVDNYESLFAGTFENTKITSIPATLFSNFTDVDTNMFYRTFADCSLLTSLPENMFASLDDADENAFEEMFAGSGLTSLPQSMFPSLDTSASSNMFEGMFSGCTHLAGYIPPTLFAQVELGQNQTPSNIMDDIFLGDTNLWTSCEAHNMTQYITGFESAWPAGNNNTYVSCFDTNNDNDLIIVTVPNAEDISLYINTTGTFTINWGDGTTNTYTTTAGSMQEIEHNYNTSAQYLVRISGQSTAYPAETYEYEDASAYRVPLISFDNSVHRNAYNVIRKVYGSFKTLLPKIGNTVPHFSQMFDSQTHLDYVAPNLFNYVTGSTNAMFQNTFTHTTSLQTIPATIFSGVDSLRTKIFEDTFYGSGITSIPENLFNYWALGTAEKAFSRTFAFCSGLTAIPATLFNRTYGTPSSNMFEETFRDSNNITHFTLSGNCSPVTYVPAVFYKNFIQTNYDNNNTYAFEGTFTNTALATTCPSGTIHTPPTFETAQNSNWGGPNYNASTVVSCAPTDGSSCTGAVYCPSSKYLPGSFSTTCANCTVGSYCPGGAYVPGLSDQGKLSCDSQKPAWMANLTVTSDANASSINACYYPIPAGKLIYFADLMTSANCPVTENSGNLSSTTNVNNIAPYYCPGQRFYFSRYGNTPTTTSFNDKDANYNDYPAYGVKACPAHSHIDVYPDATSNTLNQYDLSRCMCDEEYSLDGTSNGGMYTTITACQHISQTSCPSGQYLYNGYCYTNCPAGTYPQGTVCVTQCSNGYYLQNDTCNACPSPYTLSNGATAISENDCYRAMNCPTPISCPEHTRSCSYVGATSYNLYYGETDTHCGISVTCDTGYTNQLNLTSFDVNTDATYDATHTRWKNISGGGYSMSTTFNGNENNSDLNNGEWALTFGYGTVKGMSRCAASQGGTLGSAHNLPATSTGSYCYCQVTEYILETGKTVAFSSPTWVYKSSSNEVMGISACENDCAYGCAQTIGDMPSFRQSAYNAAGTGTANYCMPEKYTVTYTCGDGTGNAPVSQIATYNSAFTPADYTCTPPTNKHTTGYSVADTNDTKYAGTSFTWLYTSNKVFTTQYAYDKMTVQIDDKKYDSDSATSGTNPTTVSGNPSTLEYNIGTGTISNTSTNSVWSPTRPTLTHYTFNGYWTTKNSETDDAIQIVNANGVVNTSSTIAPAFANLSNGDTLTIYAHWILSSCENGYYLQNDTCNACPSPYTLSNGATAISENDCYRAMNCPTPISCPEHTRSCSYVGATSYNLYYGETDTHCQKSFDCADGYSKPLPLKNVDDGGTATRYSKDFGNGADICKLNGTTTECEGTFDNLEQRGWQVSYGNNIIVLKGKSSCNTTAGNPNTWSNGAWENLTGNSKTAYTFNTASSGSYCWCQLDSKTSYSTTVTGLSNWVFRGSYSSNAECASVCAEKCTAYMPVSQFRRALYDTFEVQRCDIDTYTITYDNGDSGCYTQTVPSQTYTVASNTITLPELSADGCVFNGWYNNEEFTGNAVTNVPTGSTGNKMFYASWEPIDISFDFYCDSEKESAFNSNTVTYLQNFDFPDSTDLTQQCSSYTSTYDQTGWECSDGNTTQTFDESMTGEATQLTFTDDFECYATWTLKTATCEAGYYLPANSLTCSQCTTSSGVGDNEWCPGGTYSYSNEDQGFTQCPAINKDTKSAIAKASYGIVLGPVDSNGNQIKDVIGDCGAVFFYSYDMVNVGNKIEHIMGINNENITSEDLDSNYDATSSLNSKVGWMMQNCLYNNATQKYDRCLPDYIWIGSICKNGYYVPQSAITLTMNDNLMENLRSPATSCVAAQAGYYTNIYDLHKNDTDLSSENSYLIDKVGVGTRAGNYYDVVAGSNATFADIYKQCPTEYPDSAAASWKKEQCYATVTFVYNNGSSNTTTKIYYDEDASSGYTVLDLPNPTKTNQVFDGWYTTSDFSGDPVNSETVFSAGNQTLYAKWLTDCPADTYKGNGACNTCPVNFPNADAASTRIANCYISLTCPALTCPNHTDTCSYIGDTTYDLHYGEIDTHCKINFACAQGYEQPKPLINVNESSMSARYTRDISAVGAEICKTNGATVDCTNSVFDDVKLREWHVVFSNGTNLHGQSSCNTTAGNPNTWGNGAWANVDGNSKSANTFVTTSSGSHCWCQLDSRKVSTTSQIGSSNWVYRGSYTSNAECASVCAEKCTAYMSVSQFRNALYGSFEEYYCSPKTVNLNWFADVSDENPTASTQCVYDTGITLPQTPTKEGYTFMGWTLSQ